MATLRVRRLDAKYDMMFGRGQANFAEKAESTAQRVVTAVKLILGEFFLDTSAGVQWWQPSDSDVRPILGGKRDLGYASAVLKQRILKVDGVKSLKSFELHVDAQRHMSGSVSIETVDGDIENIKIGEP